MTALKSQRTVPYSMFWMRHTKLSVNYTDVEQALPTHYTRDSSTLKESLWRTGTSLLVTSTVLHIQFLAIHMISTTYPGKLKGTCKMVTA